MEITRDLVQSYIPDYAASCFSERQLGDLAGVLRLTLEYFDYLQQVDSGIVDEFKLRYRCESIFAGIESFLSIASAYSILNGAVSRQSQWSISSMASLKERFVSTYREFDADVDFVKRIGLLLDLFRLQIIFAGAVYV